MVGFLEILGCSLSLINSTATEREGHSMVERLEGLAKGTESFESLLKERK